MHNPVYALNAVSSGRAPAESACQRFGILKAVGYAGAAFMCDATTRNDLAGFIASLDAAGLSLFAVRIELDVAASVSEFADGSGGASGGASGDASGDARWLDVLVAMLRGRRALLELTLSSSDGHDKPSAPRAAPRAAELVRAVRQRTGPAGIPITLCPRRGFWLQRLEDAVRIAMRVDRADVGVTFSLDDWLACDGADLEARLQLAMPRLFNVTLSLPADSPADPHGGALARALARMGYAGPVGLAGKRVDGDVDDDADDDVSGCLVRAMRVWRGAGQANTPSPDGPPNSAADLSRGQRCSGDATPPPPAGR